MTARRHLSDLCPGFVPLRQGSSYDRRTIDYTRFYIFLSVVIILIAAVSITLYMNVLEEDDDEEEETDIDTVTMNCYNPSHSITPNGTAQFVLLVENSAKSSSQNFIKIEVTSRPQGWQAYLDEPFLRLPKESRGIRFLTVKGLSGVETGTFSFVVTATSTTFEGESSSVEIDVKPKEMESNRTVQSKDTLTTNYVGYLEDGRIFDTSVESVAKSEVPKTDDFQVRSSYSEFSFTADDGQVIPGFDAGVMGMMIDQTKIIVVPPDQGYTTEGHALYGKTLYFELTMENIS